MNEINVVPGFMEIAPKYLTKIPYKLWVGMPDSKRNLRETYW